MAVLNFDANEVEPQQELKPLPEGAYKVAIVASDNKPTKSGKGSYLELKMQVLEGDHTGRPLWTRLNLQNLNAQAVQIAKSELSAICRAIGVMTPKDSSELHDRPMVATVKVSKRSDTGALTNEVKGYKSLADASRSAPPVPAAAGAAPWDG